MYNDNCGRCYNFRNTEDILNALEGVSEVKYARWLCKAVQIIRIWKWKQNI